MDRVVYEYAPIIFMDKKEPFPIKKVGFAQYTKENPDSRSFNRRFNLGNFPGSVRVLEYTYYLDYDIQHLYDLEHIWVYLDEAGAIVGAEGSYHGRFLNSYRTDSDMGKELDKGGNSLAAKIRDDRHLVMYSQPGKHAMLARPELMSLYTELFTSCDELAGNSGLDAPERYVKDIHISAQDNKKIADYIRENHGFKPSLEFEEVKIQDEDYCDLDELQERIPEYLKAQLDKLGIVYEKHT